MKTEILNQIKENFLIYLSVEKNLSTNTLISYRNDIERFFRFLILKNIPLKYVRGKNLIDYMMFLKKKGLSSSSISRNISSVRGLYRYLISKGDVNPSILNLFESPKIERKIPEILNKQTIDKLISTTNAKNNHKKIRNIAIIGLLATTGMRISELTSLKKDDINLTENWIRVIGKGNRERIVFFPEEIKPFLSYCISQNEGFLFETRKGKPMTRQNVWKIVHNSGKTAGLNVSIKPHMLRHTFATLLLESGMDIRIIQELLGHKSISTTKIYAQVSKRHLKNVHKMFHPRG
ncbi:MAG: tyrosine-type recombinase/integrase [Candidatus Omnitrophica bacterium]|nr:tyrosine-type recombinase/integrase [Candidatus Omnitrophota bacterium]MCM8817587.1 tyrosine-type recombinase/integrase [Candidatus Omnitrophota bacterium]